MQEDDDASQALSLLREIIETLANGKSLDDVSNALDRLMRDIESDERLKSYFEDLGKFVERLLKDEGYVYVLFSPLSVPV